MRRLATLSSAFGRHHPAAACCCRSLASKAGPVVDAGSGRKRGPSHEASDAGERDDSVLSDEDLTAVPTGAARASSQRAAPRAGSSMAWKKPGFAAATSDAAERAAFQRAFGGAGLGATMGADDDDIASIERDIESLKAADRTHRIQLPASGVASDDDIAGGALYADELSAAEGDSGSEGGEMASEAEVELDDEEAERAAVEYERMISVLRAPRPGAQLFGARQEEDGETAAAALSATAAQGPSLPSEGLAVDYCVFCYHGTHILRHDNMALLTKFVSERGFILPKRFTKCCAKHQRTLAKTIKRSRWMNMIPWHSKLHPKLRFSSLKPEPVAPLQGGAGAGLAGGAGPARSEAVAGGGDRGAPLSSLDRHAMHAAVAEINRFAGST